LWAVSDACHKGTCKTSKVTRYPTSGGNSTGIDVVMLYGDSSTGSSATGTIGLDTATIAGITMTDQAFSVVNDTDNLVVQYDAAGIFGLGFPAGRLFVPASSRSFTHSLVCCLAKFRNRSSRLR